MMFHHLMSRRHRQRFVDQLYKNRRWPFRNIDLSPSQLLEIADANAENKADLDKKIKTRRSDEVFLERTPPTLSPSPLKAKFSGIPGLASRKGSLDPGKGRHWLHS